ncbi:hypothetical protein NDU88_004559 [Pleurodeles waltl]|uniref:Uncharacterized protein n=1 Tax=Pleurodeles waltl TaxID=8319 RepID=A0AAV7LKA7_PLEWA|nr:hypothetical protein NDU88_004559 [Pleurodeles waltl]
MTCVCTHVAACAHKKVHVRKHMLDVAQNLACTRQPTVVTARQPNGCRCTAVENALSVKALPALEMHFQHHSASKKKASGQPKFRRNTAAHSKTANRRIPGKQGPAISH